mmetsp:Transcript_3063/g.6777  ORF Transcript_3063/g.6777 Transcript_3063/m.6777 type:complete len:104 (+) Transcript_3063:197-508(+)
MVKFRGKKMDKILSTGYPFNTMIAVSAGAAMLSAVAMLIALRVLGAKNNLDAASVALALWTGMKVVDAEAPVWQGAPLHLILITYSKSLATTMAQALVLINFV